MIAAVLRGNAFFNMGGMAKSMIMRAPRAVMNISSLHNRLFHSPSLPPMGLRTIEHTLTHGSAGATPSRTMKNLWSRNFVGFIKRQGLQANNMGATGDLTLAASVLRHQNTI